MTMDNDKTSFTFHEQQIPKLLDEKLWRNVKHENLYLGSISTYIIELIDKEQGRSFEEKELSFLTKVKPRLGYYYLMLNFDGLWGNGGMQAVTLRDEFDFGIKILNKTIEAFRFYGADKHANLIEKLIPVARKTQKDLENAKKLNKKDEEFKNIWAQIDKFDILYDEVCAEYDPYQKIIEDAHKYPEKIYASIDKRKIQTKVPNNVVE